MEGSSHRNKISIHPPLEGWDRTTAGGTGRKRDISIHPPREGWDNCDFCSKLLIVVFQSTHPVRGGTTANAHIDIRRIFQSTHPVRGGTSRALSGFGAARISIHPPREGWD